MSDDLALMLASPAWVESSESTNTNSPKYSFSLEEDFLLLPTTAELQEKHPGTLDRSAEEVLLTLKSLAHDDSISPLLPRPDYPGEAIVGPQVHRGEESDSEMFGILRKYDGEIFGREGDTFWARLKESSTDFQAIEANFHIDELNESDRALAVDGAAVVWTIGYSNERGTRKRQSILYVRRLRPISKEEVASSREETKRLMSGINWD